MISCVSISTDSTSRPKCPDVPRLVFLDSAGRDIADIAARIERDSMSRATADIFINKLVAYCQRLSERPILMGRARPELRTAYRSATFGNYVIFLSYDSEGNGPRDVLKIVHVLWGARDLDAYFIEHPDDEAEDGT